MRFFSRPIYRRTSREDFQSFVWWIDSGMPSRPPMTLLGDGVRSRFLSSSWFLMRPFSDFGMRIVQNLFAEDTLAGSPFFTFSRFSTPPGVLPRPEFE